MSTEQIENEEAPRSFWEAAGNRFLMFQVMPSWLTSFIIHMILIILLAIFAWEIPKKVLVSLESGEPSEDIAAFEDINFDSMESSELDENTETEETNEEVFTETLETTEIDDTMEMDSMSDVFDAVDTETTIDQSVTGMTGMAAGAENATAGRTESERSKLVRQNGGNAASENAVKLAMQWLKNHQLPDGSWNFDHRTGPGSHRTSKNPGDFRKAPNAATAMALLVFLGAGQTHVEGDYQETVEKGLAFLLRNGRMTRAGLSFYEDQGGLYNHGLAAMTLLEAYAMTDDQRLAEPAQAALRYIEFCQDPVGGGWRYEPKQAGDTSAVGWQIMALKSANMSGLTVDPATIRKARSFLEFVSSESSGAFYGYTHPVKDRIKGLTSVGLLCQMYLGWTKENPALGRGVAWLGDRGPAIGDWKPGQAVTEKQKSRMRCGMYYNYYATQVMHQFGGETWDDWNTQMRDFLIATQATEGNAKGSWFFHDGNEGGYVHGGRLYATTLAAMTLEVYYRYLPLYDDKKTSEDEFILD